jgi:2-dehydro-3-deoxy-D-gluconate 5-dehydrogenase
MEALGRQVEPPAFDLSGRLAVVTGVRRGIGLAIAEALATSGADVLGVSRDLEPDGGQARACVEGLGRRFIAIRADLSDRTSMRELLARIEEIDRPIDILVNNAGTIYREPAVTHSLEEWDRVIEVNLSSQFMLTQAIGEQMLNRGSGKVIFTTSMLSFQGGINVPSYTASKHGLAGLTKALANEWAARGVNVNAIAPGYIATDNTQALRNDPVRSKAILERIPAGRWGSPSDVAWTAVFLASRASDYLHGAVLPVDGGWLGR